LDREGDSGVREERFKGALKEYRAWLMRRLDGTAKAMRFCELQEEILSQELEEVEDQLRGMGEELEEVEETKEEE